MVRSTANLGAAVLFAAYASAPGGQAAGALWVNSADPRHEASIITVTNVDQLSRALASAHGGDTIRLAPGVYSGLGHLRGLNYASGVTITSADASHPAVIAPFYLHNSSNITFTHIEFSAPKYGSFAYRIYESKGIAFDHDSFHGEFDGASSDVSSSGVGFNSSENVSVTNSDFTRLVHGLAISDSSGAVFSGNSFHDMRCDGFDIASSNNIHVENNVFTDFHPATGDHPDAIQLWGLEGAIPSHDVTISGNLAVRSGGAPIQGVFLRDAADAFRAVTISNNIIVGEGYNGIAVSGAQNVSVLSNTVVAYSGMDSWIRMENINGLTMSNNVAYKFIISNNAKVSQSANSTKNYVSDGGKALVAKWLAAHPGWTGTFPASLSQLVGAGPGAGS